MHVFVTPAFRKLGAELANLSYIVGLFLINKRKAVGALPNARNAEEEEKKEVFTVRSCIDCFRT